MRAFKNYQELRDWYDSEKKASRTDPDRHPFGKVITAVVYHGTRRKESALELKEKGFCSFAPGEVDDFIDEAVRLCKVVKNGPRICKWIDDAAAQVKETYRGRVGEFGKNKKPDLYVSAQKDAACSWAFRNPEIVSDAMYWNLPRIVKNAILEEMFGTPKKVTLKLRLPAEDVVYENININTNKHCFKPEEIVSVEECGHSGVFKSYKASGMEFHLPKSWEKE